MGEVLLTRRGGIETAPPYSKALEYIASSGPAYIDTEFKPTNNTRIVIDFQATNDHTHVFGARTAYKDKAFLLYWSSDSSSCVQVNNSSFNGGTFSLTDRHTVEMTASSMIMDGVTKVTYSVEAFETIHNLYLFSSSNSEVSENMAGRIYSCQIYESNVLVRDFIPVLDNNDVACLYDKTNQAFYYNAGTGDFNHNGMGIDVSDATAVAADVLSGKTFYAGSDAAIKTGTLTGQSLIKFASGNTRAPKPDKGGWHATTVTGLDFTPTIVCFRASSTTTTVGFIVKHDIHNVAYAYSSSGPRNDGEIFDNGFTCYTYRETAIYVEWYAIGC